MRTLDVYVVSDVHLGGAPATESRLSFQMCPAESRRRLARFVESVRTATIEGARRDADRELIINGDLVDFLAEEPFLAFTPDPKKAIGKLRAIIRTCDEGAPAEEQLFPALRRFVADGHRLTVMLGNHDLELTLPDVRHELIGCLTEGRPARLELLFDGEACRRGTALLEHGNRYDGWNAVAHGTLRALRARASRGEPEYPFSAPAGSQLVAEVMNPLKSQYQFIDLLKPENEALIPILGALHPAALRQIRRIFNKWRQTTSLRPGVVPDRESYVGDLATDADIVPDIETLVATRVSGAASTAATLSRNGGLDDEVTGDVVDDETLRRTEALLDESERMLAELTADDEDVVPDEYSQVGDGIIAWLSSTSSLIRVTREKRFKRYQHLRNALAAHRRTIGTTFALGVESAHYLEAANRMEGPDTQFVVFGHTHLPKSIALKGGGRYLNTGTWCRTIRLPEHLYQPGGNDADAVRELERFVEDMRTNRLESWTALRTPFAHIVVEPDGRTTADLCEFHDDGRVTAPMSDAP